MPLVSAVRLNMKKAVRFLKKMIIRKIYPIRESRDTIALHPSFNR